MKRKISMLVLLLVVAMACKKDKNGPDLNKGLISYFNFDDNVTDQLGYANDGTGNATFVPGKIGKALNFNGTNQLMSFLPKSPTPIYKISTAYWIYSSSTGIIFSNNPHDATADFLFFHSFGKLYFSIDTSTGLDGCSNNIDLDQWHFVVVTYNGAKVDLYMDGALKETKSLKATNGFYDNYLVLGGLNGTYWKGQIDELRIYNRALSPEEVTMLYNLK